MTQAELTLPRRSFGQTMRADVWWAQPLIVFLGLGRVCCLFDLGGVPGAKLLFRPLSFAVLFAGDFWRVAAQLVRPETALVAGLAPFFSGASRPLGAGRFSAHLLLLPRRLLQGFLGRSTGLHCRRAAQHLSRRAFVPAHHAECASLFSLSRAALSSSCSRMMSGKRSGSPIRRPERLRSGSASARWCWR